jgi:preprotein translocase subunit YajC
LSEQTWQLIIIVAILVGMYFFLIYPQQRRLREHRKLIRELEIGDVVVTAGGVIGRIVNITGQTVVLEVNGIKLKFLREAVVRKIG